MSSECMTRRGVLKGHNGWVTAITVPQSATDMIISSSRDKSIIVWTITNSSEESEFGIPRRRLTGHDHYVQDVTSTVDGKYILSGSWDGTLRLWDTEDESKNTVFRGHTKDVLSVAFSDTNKYIVSGSRDNTIKVWNVVGRCAATIAANKSGHSDWVSCVRISTSNAGTTPSYIVSASWDNTVKIWSLERYELRHVLTGHSSFVNTVTLAPDGSLCATGDRNGKAILWDLAAGHSLWELEAGDCVNALTFSPARFWLCAATPTRIVVWDLETKLPIDEIPNPQPKTESKKVSQAQPVQCLCLAWSVNGNILYAGYTDNTIVAYVIKSE